MRKLALITLIFGCLVSGVAKEKKVIDFVKYDENCTNKDKFSCLDIGMILYQSDQKTPAKYYLNEACKFDLVAGCDLLGHIYTKENNATAATEIFNKTCDNNSSYGCLNLGVIYMNDKNDINQTAAKEKLIKACKMRDVRACELLNLL